MLYSWFCSILLCMPLVAGFVGSRLIAVWGCLESSAAAAAAAAAAVHSGNEMEKEFLAVLYCSCLNSSTGVAALPISAEGPLGQMAAFNPWTKGILKCTCLLCLTLGFDSPNSRLLALNFPSPLEQSSYGKWCRHLNWMPCASKLRHLRLWHEKQLC